MIDKTNFSGTNFDFLNRLISILEKVSTISKNAEFQELADQAQRHLQDEKKKIQFEKNDYKFITRSDVAITGRVGKSGNFLPVDENGLKLKVEACYFSHIRYLVVPKEQVEICNQFLRNLGKLNEVVLTQIQQGLSLR